MMKIILSDDKNSHCASIKSDLVAKKCEQPCTMAVVINVIERAKSQLNFYIGNAWRMVASNKDAIFCVKCGEKNNASSIYCVGCGTKLARPKTMLDEDLKKQRQEEERLNQVTLKNMSSKIAKATFMVAKVIVKTSIVSLRPKLPNRYDSATTKVLVILSGTLKSAYDVTDEVKKKILEDVSTDLSISQVEWTTSSLASSALIDRGWSAIYSKGQWYIWPTSGSTIKTLITVKYVEGSPHREVVEGEVYSRDNLDRDQTSEIVWTVLGVIATVVIIIIWLISR